MSGAETGAGAQEGAEVTHTQYADVVDPSNVLLARAGEPAHPILPKKEHIRSWEPTSRKALNPLVAGLTGTGRAGKEGVLIGSAGGRYEGQVLAGRPHGLGRYYAAAPAGAVGGAVLEYEGEWHKGARTGRGTRWYAARGEVYVGQLLDGRRDGLGRHEYAGGDVYEGRWRADRRHGPGRLMLAGGDIFVGAFVGDVREGLGTLFLVSKGRKYVGEWVAGKPVCGSMSDLLPLPLGLPQALEGDSGSGAIGEEQPGASGGPREGGEAPPPGSSVAAAIAIGTGRLAMSGAPPPAPLPRLCLAQPGKVVAGGVEAVRAARPARLAATVEASTGTLGGLRLTLLKHAFVLLAGGDGADPALPCHKLTDLVVLSGLDPAQPTTQQLVARLQAQAQAQQQQQSTQARGGGGGSLIRLGAFLDAASHFRDPQGLQAQAYAEVPPPPATLGTIGAGSMGRSPGASSRPDPAAASGTAAAGAGELGSVRTAAEAEASEAEAETAAEAEVEVEVDAAEGGVAAAAAAAAQEGEPGAGVADMEEASGSAAVAEEAQGEEEVWAAPAAEGAGDEPSEALGVEAEGEGVGEEEGEGGGGAGIEGQHPADAGELGNAAVAADDGEGVQPVGSSEEAPCDGCSGEGARLADENAGEQADGQEGQEGAGQLESSGVA